MKQKILTVSEITRYIKDTLESMVGRVRVTGEVSGFKIAASGHCYFTLKDDRASLNCVMFRGSFSRVSFAVKDGMQLEALGKITVYAPRGQYQMIVDKLTEAGIGELYRKFEAMKKRLAEEGLFDKNRKKNLPWLPRRIGVITSATGAAVRDIVNVLTRRFPHLHIYLYPTLVQGNQAAAQIAHAIRKMNQLKLADVLIVGRGGGSIEDLWAFNEETVARAISESEIPIVSAVGHETDFTIADFVADERAPTPSAAAEIVTANHQQLMESITLLNQRLNRAMLNWIDMKRLKLNSLAESRILHSPLEKLRQYQQRLDELTEKATLGLTLMTERTRQKLKILDARLTALSPESVLSRGFSIVVSQKTGKVVKDAEQVDCGEILDVTPRKGHFKVEVRERTSGE